MFDKSQTFSFVKLFSIYIQSDTPCNGLFSRRTWVSRHQKGKTNLEFNEARDDGVTVASAGPHANHLHVASDYIAIVRVHPFHLMNAD